MTVSRALITLRKLLFILITAGIILFPTSQCKASDGGYDLSLNPNPTYRRTPLLAEINRESGISEAGTTTEEDSVMIDKRYRKPGFCGYECDNISLYQSGCFGVLCLAYLMMGHGGVDAESLLFLWLGLTFFFMEKDFGKDRLYYLNRPKSTV